MAQIAKTLAADPTLTILTEMAAKTIAVNILAGITAEGRTYKEAFAIALLLLLVML